jgi:hypothetical protein
MGPDVYKMSVLKTRGVPAEGHITYLHSELVHSKSGDHEVFHADYTFSPDPTPGSQTVPYADTSIVNASEYGHLRVGQTVPVIYDPSKQDRSAINVGDRVHTQDPMAAMRLLAKFMLPLFGGMSGLGLVFMLVGYYREKKLLMWGNVAAATITEEKEYSAGKSGMAMAATYQFKDGNDPGRA